MTDINKISTDLVALFITPHGLQRREERQQTLRELWAAVRHGKKEPADPSSNGELRWKFTFAGVVVITDYQMNTIVTSWNLSGYEIEIPKAEITETMRLEHENALHLLRDKAKWKSHTVAVVDQSGSMRTTDAEKGITRSDLVWSTMALAFIAEKLKSGERQPTDVFSLVSMRDKGEILLRDQPFDWVLYNNVVELFRTQQPRGAGNYFPALETANYLLRSNTYSGCALMLVFLSDGRPSDKFAKGELPVPNTHSVKIRKKIGNIASRIGHRLTVGAIPLGKPKQDEFVTLKALMEGAKEYGSHGFFQPPTLSANVLSIAMTTLTSTLTSTMVDMGHRQCRSFRKEPVSNVGGTVLTCQFDKVAMKEYVATSRFGRTVKHHTITRNMFIPGQGWKSFPSKSVFHSPYATGIAMKKAWFGEGAERLVKEFREVDKHGVFVGPIMVAKDTKFLQEAPNGQPKEVNGENAKEFHKVFCKTQIKAQKYAHIFNQKVSMLHKYDALTPRLEFLDCSVYMIETIPMERHGYLVERMLDIQKFEYRKWNDNAGFVCNKLGGQEPRQRQQLQAVRPDAILETLFEEDDDDGDDSSTDEEFVDQNRLGTMNHQINFHGHVFNNNNPDTCFGVEDIPQAFSCFSYWQSKRRFLICDLQGIMNTDRHPPVFELTDPVIHHRDSFQGSKKYGRTDKGLGGMVSFFDTHKCSNLCRMLKSRFQIQIELPSGLHNQNATLPTAGTS